MQNDFMPGGALGVGQGDAIVPLINTLGKNFANVVLTQDWHPPGHASFASSHPGARPFDRIAMPYGEQVLWPDHCVQGSPGAALHKGLAVDHAILIIRKGYHPAVDSYSAFMEADRKTSTGLAGFLKEKGVRRVFACGVATDYCVGWSALDASRRRLRKLSRSKTPRRGDRRRRLAERAWAKMQGEGVKRIQSADIAG